MMNQTIDFEDDGIQMVDYVLEDNGVVTLTEIKSNREINIPSKGESTSNKRPQRFNKKADSIVKRQTMTKWKLPQHNEFNQHERKSAT